MAWFVSEVILVNEHGDLSIFSLFLSLSIQ